jgi:hypothetical protein
MSDDAKAEADLLEIVTAGLYSFLTIKIKNASVSYDHSTQSQKEKGKSRPISLKLRWSFSGYTYYD